MQQQASRARYADLVSAFCRLADLNTECAAILDDGRLVVGGIAMTLKHDDTRQDGSVTIYCDCGDLPEKGAREWHRKLLELNLFTMCGEACGGLAVNSQTGRVVFIKKLMLDFLDGASLIVELEDCARLSGNWRALLEEEDVLLHTDQHFMRKGKR